MSRIALITLSIAALTGCILGNNDGPANDSQVDGEQPTNDSPPTQEEQIDDGEPESDEPAREYTDVYGDYLVTWRNANYTCTVEYTVSKVPGVPADSTTCNGCAAIATVDFLYEDDDCGWDFDDIYGFDIGLDIEGEALYTRYQGETWGHFANGIVRDGEFEGSTPFEDDGDGWQVRHTIIVQWY